MRRQAIDHLRAAIEANTEKRSIDQLKAQGKRHVRVVSGEKVMQIIKAIVNDIVDREVGELNERDRERIVNETKGQFDRVLKLQTEQDALLKQQKELAEEYRGKLEAVQADHDRTRAQLEELRAQQSGREAKLLGEYQEKITQLTEQGRDAADQARDLAQERKRLEESLAEVRARRDEREERLKADYETRIEQLHKEQRDLVARFESERGDVAGRQEAALQAAQQRATDLEARLSETSEARIGAEQRAERLERDVEEARTQATEAQERNRKAERIIAKQEARFAKARAVIENAQTELTRLHEEKARLESELASVRERAGESDAVQQLQGQLAEMQTYLRTLDEKSSGANEATVSALLEQLSERQTLDSSSLEEKFAATLDSSLDKITRTMEAATAKPIDVVVEATDVLVDKLFDAGDDVLSSNLADLNVEERTSKAGIAGNLQALKAMRAAQTAPKAAEEEEEKAEEKPAAEPVEGLNGPEAEAAVASHETRKKLSASMERLKAVRGGSGKDA